MTATDELRKLLDERGVEWWPMHDVENDYQQDRDTEFLVYGCKHVAHEWGCRLQVDMLTPEQVITATLGSGTLTADDVLNAVYKHGARWQAIADELNATLGSGTCKLEETESYSSERGIVHVLECSNCGQECEHVNGDYEYCPHCLARNALF